MISQRDAFFQRVYELAKENRDIIVISADMGTSALEPFQRDLPGQFVDAGIAEQNAINVAAGLALEGKRVFVFAIAPFITLRCYEQIRTSICMMNLPVTIVGVGAGVSYDESGPTHHAVEDISVMRVLPNMQIFNITNAVMAEEIASLAVESPTYVRVDRKCFLNETGKGPESDYIIFSTGNMLELSFKIAKKLDYGYRAIEWFPIEAEDVIPWVGGKKQIITIEEHTLPGGLGSAVLEVLADNNIQIPVKRIGMNISEGYCYQYGRKNIQKIYGLDKESIIKTIKGEA